MDSDTTFEPAPKTFRSLLTRLGPGLVTVAAVVGSGELIATTKTGAESGTFLLWLIILGCAVKVLPQIELGKYSICTNRGTIEALNRLPGPRLHQRWGYGLNWAFLIWLLTFVPGILQLGGVAHGVGQSLALMIPLTGDFAAGGGGSTYDDVIWATLAIALTALLLVNGRYSVVQSAVTLMVGIVTVMTLLAVITIQFQPEWRISGQEFLQGLRFELPPVIKGFAENPMLTALATFGIIGIGANELVAYGIWCIDGGFAKNVGKNDGSGEWLTRAKSWIRVLRWDAVLSMFIYTFSTLAFYLLGASVLHRQRLNLDGDSMIQTLAVMYASVFGPAAATLFYFGAVMVLYSTLFAATASHARVVTDAVRVCQGTSWDPKKQKRYVQAFCLFIPVLAFLTLMFFRDPVTLILLGGLAQGILLPVLAGMALYYRYTELPKELRTSKLWDGALWLSTLSFLVIAFWVLYQKGLSHLF